MSQNIREALKAFYPQSKKWARKVDAMSDSQAFATYVRIFQERYRRSK